MKVEAVRLNDPPAPAYELALYRDTNGHWFAGATRQNARNSTTVIYTATYTTPIEAVQDALDRLPLPD